VLAFYRPVQSSCEISASEVWCTNMLVGQRAFPPVFGPNRAACPLFWSIALVEKVGEDFLVGIQDLVSGHTELECELDGSEESDLHIGGEGPFEHP